MFSNFNSQSALFNPSINLYETIIEIYTLFGKLGEIYSSKFPKMLPTEVLQYTHGIELIASVMQKQKIDPQIAMGLQTSFYAELYAIYIEYSQSIAQYKPHGHATTHKDTNPQYAHHVWQDNPTFHLLKNLHQLTRKYSFKWLHALNGIDHITKEQLHFYLNNILSLMAPTNTMWSNPEVIESILASGGANLVLGFKNYLDDLVQNNGQLNIRMTDLRSFKVGENLAATPGKVIYQNELIQLIQYSPSTDSVYTTPILITPPWINKFYVLDLSKKNSLVKWLIAQGFTVYMISWVNPDESFADKQFEDYMQQGPLDALDVVIKTANVKAVHMVGYCIGGTLLASTLAYMAQKNDKRALSATFLMSLINFKEPGEIGVFLDEPQLAAIEKLMQSYGYLNGHLLDMTFNLLRPNDLIWPYFINNYLLGKETKPFDILFWNADSANLPYKMYIFYLRNMYLHNNLVKPGGITLSGVPIDVSKIKVPTMFLAAESDHITLWKAIYSGIHFLSGPVDFVLTESGHVRGVVNPPETKYNYRINRSFKNSSDYVERSAEWIKGAEQQQGTWWIYWQQWLAQHDDTKVAARKIPQALVIEDAPGSYVLKRL